MNERILFEAAIAIADPEARRAFLEKACTGNPELLADVLALLTSHYGLDSFLENSPVKAEARNKSALFDLSTDRTEPDTDHQNSDIKAILALLTPSTKPDSKGTLGHYEIIKCLGQGGFGTVLKAFDSRLHRLVAIKVLSPTLAVTSPPRKRFLREARSGASINHDNVVQVYSVEEHPLPYLVMEFVDGYTLQDKMNREGPFEMPELVNIGRQIATGLAAAHALGLIHRDIKPNNILLANGIEQKVKITDFGLARSVDDANLTQSGMVVGTPMYMAPEQARADKLDHRADLFSFGSVLYAMVTGHPPFRAPNTLAVLRRVAEDTPRPLQEWIPELPFWLVALINKLLAKNPDQRFQTAQEVAEILRRHQSERQANDASPAKSLDVVKILDEEPSTAVSRAGRRKKLLPVTIGGILGVSVVLAGIVISLKPGDKDVASVAAVPQPESSIPKPKVQEKPKLTREEPKPANPWETPAFQQWMKDVAGMTAEQQIEAVRKKLVELNPDFDGTIHGSFWNRPPQIENGHVVAIGFSGEHVSDLTPVRAFPMLRELCCASGVDPADGRLKDLSPLKGIPLRMLAIFQTNVSDLSPLRGMPLEELHFWNTPVSDIAPLKGMSLRYVNFINSPVTDFSALKGMPLTEIDANFDPERDSVNTEIVRSISTLETINHKPAADFWKEVDEKLGAKNGGPACNTPAFKAWVKEVAGMTAEDQVEAVKKTLVQLNPDFSAEVKSGLHCACLRISFSRDSQLIAAGADAGPAIV
jgi:eukaryotic-like serine/threonine-protein kinase